MTDKLSRERNKGENMPDGESSISKCYGLNVLPKFHMLRSQHPVGQNVTIFGNRVLAEAIS